MNHATPRYLYHRKRDGILRIDTNDNSCRYLTKWEALMYRWKKFWGL